MTVRTDMCRGCGQPFEQELRQGRPRVYCSTCRPEKASVPKPARPVAPGLKADPPVREDGRCVVCLKPRKITPQTRKYAGVAIDLDPFCSTECCRRWHGVEVHADASEEQVEAGRAAAAAFREAHGWREVA